MPAGAGRFLRIPYPQHFPAIPRSLNGTSHPRAPFSPRPIRGTSPGPSPASGNLRRLGHKLIVLRVELVVSDRESACPCFPSFYTQYTYNRTCIKYWNKDMTINKKSTLQRALAAQEGELTLSAPRGNAGYRPNPSPWRCDAFLCPQNLRQRVVATPRAE